MMSSRRAAWNARFGRSPSNDAISNAISGAYVATVQKAPHLFGGLYKVGDKISSDRHKSPIYLMNIAQTGALKRSTSPLHITG